MNLAGLKTVHWAHAIDEPVIAVRPLPGARALAVGSEGLVRVLDEHGTVRHELHLDDAPQAVAVDPDGRLALIGGMTGHTLVDLDAGQVISSGRGRWCGAAQWSPDGNRVTIADGRNVRQLGRDGTELWASSPLPSTVTGLATIRDGRRIAAAAYQGVQVLESADGATSRSLAAPGAIAGLAVAPSGRWIVGGSQDATLHGWKVPDGNDFRMMGFPTTVSRLAFHPDGRWLICDGGNHLIGWDFSGAGPTGRNGLTLDGHQAQVTAFTWVDGAAEPTLISGDEDGALFGWRVAGPQARPGETLRPAVRGVHLEPVTDLAHQDGTLLVGSRTGIVAAFEI